MGFLSRRKRRFTMTDADLASFVCRTGLIPVASRTSWLRKVRNWRPAVRF